MVTPTILVIDDDRVLTRLFEGILNSVGKVMIANTGVAGLELARTEQPDLILLDVQMPGQDGFDIISELKTDPMVRHIPVIFITGEILPEIESHCLEAGGADYIAKPVNPRVLKARALTHLLIKQQSDMLADLTYRDALTDAINRAAFAEMLAVECDRAAWKNRAISLLLIDVDHFKAYNAIYGHIAGDDVLASIVMAISKIANRPGDIVARIAGDRFAVLLPETPATTAVEIAKRSCEAVRRLGVRNSGSATADVVTVTIGVGSADGATTPAALLGSAEAQLRRGKTAGRARVAALT